MNTYNFSLETITTMDHLNKGQPTYARRCRAANRFAARPTAMAIALVTFSTIMSATLPVHAEVKDGQVELSPFVGYHMFESDQNLEDALTYGVRLGYSFTPNWAIEGAVSAVGSSVDDISLTGAEEGQFRSPMDNVDLLLYQIDALYHFRPDQKFSPYIVGGYGVIDYSPSISDKEMSAFNFGVGAKYWLSDKLALRFDLRDHLVSEMFDHAYHNISATVGLSFAFGGQSEPTAAREVAPTPTEAPVAAEVVVLEFEDIHFDFDKSTLTPEARRILKRSITILQDNPKAKVRIAGYTSAAGTAEHNQGLSERRASAIKEFLISDGGISRNRLSVIGYGDTRPSSYEATPKRLNTVAAKENMRALFEIVVE